MWKFICLISLCLFSKININALDKISESSLLATHPEEHADFKQLSDWLKTLQTGLQEETGIDRIYIGGGAARAILDHLYFDRPLTMRDLDVFIVANRPVDEEFARRIGQKLESTDFGYFSRNDLRSRPRVPTTLPILERQKYNAGFGFFWVRDNGEILDLSIYHTKEDLHLNGVFDVETIMIVLSAETALEDFAKRAQTIPFQQLVDAGTISDLHHGYRSWLNRDAKVVNWNEIEASPILRTFRVVRTYAKLGRSQLPESYEKNLRYLISLSKPENPLQLTRSLLKVLEDDHPEMQLKMLLELGVIQSWMPKLGQELSHFSVAQLKQILDQARPAVCSRGDPLSMGKFRALLEFAPPEERLATLYDGVYAFSPETALLWMLEKSASNSLLTLSHPASLDRKIERIAKSSVIPLSEKRQLLISTLLTPLPLEKRPAFLSAAFPSLPEEERMQLIRQSERKRIGFYTGVFNPVHKGHLDLIKQAIEQKALDELVIIPTVGTNHNEKPLPWEDRWQMIHLSLEEIPEATLIDATYIKELSTSTGAALDRLCQSRGEKVDWVHVMGTDSFERYAKAGFLEKDNLSQGNEVLVIHRNGYKFYPIPPDVKRHVYYYIKPVQKGETPQEYSSSKIRKLLQEGKSIADLVHPKVADFIEKQELYSPQNDPVALTFITTNDKKFQEIHTIIPDAKQRHIDLPKIQDATADELVKAKLLAALDFEDGHVIVSETFLEIDCLNGLPGPHTKDFMQTLGVEGLLKLLSTHQEKCPAKMVTITGYAKSPDQTYFFKAAVEGSILSSKTASGIDYTYIFIPNGADKTLGEMSLKEKYFYSSTLLAAKQLQQHLEQ